MQDNPENEVAVPSQAAPGALLKAQRQAYGWSESDVASALHLSVKQVESIEQDAYDQLPGATYIQGYWQSYARLLEMDISTSVDAHRHLLTDDHTRIAPTPSHQQIRGNDEQSRKHLALLFCLLLSVFLAAVWYWRTPDNRLTDLPLVKQLMEWSGQTSSVSSDDLPDLVVVESNAVSETLKPLKPLQAEQNSADLSTNEPVDSASIIALPVPNFSNEPEDSAGVLSGNGVINDPFAETGETSFDLPDDGKEESESSSDTNGKLPNTQDQDVANDPVVIGWSNSTDSTGQLQQQNEVANDADETVDIGRDVVKEADAVNQAVEPSTTETLAASAEPEAALSTTALSDTSATALHIKLNRETWLDVRNFKGEKLVYRTVPQKEVVSIKGYPPFYIFVGSAEGVEVIYKGASIPFEINPNGAFARFTVGKE